MPCSYLTKFAGERNYQHKLFEGCNSSSPSMAAVNHFIKENPGLKAKDFDPETFTGNTQVWVISQSMVSIHEELYEVYPGPVKIIKDRSLPFEGDNILDGVGWQARKIKEVPPRVVPYLAGLLNG